MDKNEPNIVAICGSLRDESNTRIALTHALNASEKAGGDPKLIDLRHTKLPLFDPDDRRRGDAVEIKRVVRNADSILLGTPVYHGMPSSALKNIFDYLGKEEFDKTVVGLLATAGGNSYSHTLAQLRTGIRSVHGWVLPHEVGLRNASDVFNERNEFVDQDLEERVNKLARMLANYTVTQSRIEG